MIQRRWWQVALAHGLLWHGHDMLLGSRGKVGGFKSERAYLKAKARRKMQAASRKANR